MDEDVTKVREDHETAVRILEEVTGRGARPTTSRPAWDEARLWLTQVVEQWENMPDDYRKRRVEKALRLLVEEHQANDHGQEREDWQVCPNGHEEAFQLCEEGYARGWSSWVDERGDLHATWGGSEDFSENGDGVLFFECLQCMAQWLPPAAVVEAMHFD